MNGMIFRNTMMPCQTPGMCAPFQGCQPAQQEVKIGWKCPVCGKGNAPFMPTCGNQLCGVDLSKGATA